MSDDHTARPNTNRPSPQRNTEPSSTANTARNITGWALVDEHGGVRGWHQQIPGDPTWSDRHSAMRGFIPDSGRRLWQTRRGWVVVADPDRYLLGLYLTALRSGVFGTGGRLRR